MKNTKSIIMTLTTIAAMSLCFACAKIDRVPDPTLHELTISPLSSATVKSTPEALADGTVFGVFSYISDMSGETEWTTALPAAESYIENAAFKYSDGIAQGWNLSSEQAQPYYWPLDGSLMFAGYSPHVSVSNETISRVSFSSGAEGTNPHMTIPFTQNTDPTKMVDLLWFDVGDVNNGRTMSKTAEKVDVVFKHALAMLEFNITYEHFHSVTARLTECIFTATFFSGRTPGWLPSDDPEKLVTLEFSPTPKPVFYMIPQFTDGTFPTMDTQIGDEIKLNLVVVGRIPKVETPDENDYIETHFSIDIPIKDYTPRWEIGKKYVYNVSIVPKSIEFGEPTVEIKEQVFNL